MIYVNTTQSTPNLVCHHSPLPSRISVRSLQLYSMRHLSFGKFVSLAFQCIRSVSPNIKSFSLEKTVFICFQFCSSEIKVHQFTLLSSSQGQRLPLEVTPSVHLYLFSILKVIVPLYFVPFEMILTFYVYFAIVINYGHYWMHFLKHWIYSIQKVIVKGARLSVPSQTWIR